MSRAFHSSHKSPLSSVPLFQWLLHPTRWNVLALVNHVFFCLCKPSPCIGHHPMKPLFHCDMHSGCSSLSAMFTLMVIFFMWHSQIFGGPVLLKLYFREQTRVSVIGFFFLSSSFCKRKSKTCMTVGTCHMLSTWSFMVCAVSGTDVFTGLGQQVHVICLCPQPSLCSAVRLRLRLREGWTWLQ